jgi:hypothetical protein
MTSKYKNGLLAACLLLSGYFSYAQSRWSFEFQNGGTWSLDLPLIIKQDGCEDIVIKHADFYSEPFKSPPYWNMRLSKWWKKKSLELEFVHHKFYLRNRPPEVERFGISHGYNMLFLNHGREAGKYILRAGFGTNFIHAESTVRGLKQHEESGLDLGGHSIRGVSFNVGCARKLKLGKNFFLNAEAKVHGSAANAPVVNGYARVHIVVFQLILGPGVNWCVRKDS